MSATNRGAQRLEDDYYATPHETAREGLFAALSTLNVNLATAMFLDPCAGGDEDRDMAYPEVLVGLGADPKRIVTLDIRPDSRARFKGFNYLAAEPESLSGMFDVVASNPPYVLAQRFVLKSLSIVKPGGAVVFLLRLNFLGSQGRAPFWQKYPPAYVFVHSRRPSFTGNGTDATEYAHFVWVQGSQPEHAKLRVL